MTSDEIIIKLNNNEFDRKKAKAWLSSIPKTEQERKVYIFTKIQENTAFSKDELISWLSQKEFIENKDDAIKEVVNVITKKKKNKPTSFKKGDVVMHAIFNHPCVLLEYKKETDKWICGSLTSEPNCKEILEVCKSRFFPDSYFTNVLFTMSNPEQYTFMFVYDNNRHLTSVLKKLKEIFV